MRANQRKKSTPPAIIARLKQAIRQSRLSLNSLARRAGVSQGQLSHFISGNRTLTMPAAAKVCQVLGLSLFNETEEWYRAATRARDLWLEENPYGGIVNSDTFI